MDTSEKENYDAKLTARLLISMVITHDLMMMILIKFIITVIMFSNSIKVQHCPLISPVPFGTQSH